jgi:mono/diheme cytochrome c family protein
MMRHIRQFVCFALAGAALAAPGCRQDMQNQPKYKPLRPSRFFADGRSARPIPRGSVARDELNDTDVLHTGLDDGTFATRFPVQVTRPLLQRGEERYNIYCTPCHGFLGDGNGMIARRGFKWPANLHTERLRNAPPGYLFQVVSNGYGAMPAYRSQIAPDDRWAVLAYVRALQLSRNATFADVDSKGRAELEKQP